MKKLILPRAAAVLLLALAAYGSSQLGAYVAEHRHAVPQPQQQVLVDAPAYTQRIPNDCAITATEVYARLTAAGIPTRLLALDFIDRTGSMQGHMVTVWQPFRGSPILFYDLYFVGATAELSSVRVLDARAIGRSFSNTIYFKLSAIRLLDAHFVE